MRTTDAEDVDVVSFRTLGAQRRHLIRGRRPKPTEHGAGPEPVPVVRATAIVATAFDGEPDANAWLEGCRRKEAERERAVEAALRVVNRAVHGHRLAASDPYVTEVTRGQAQRVTVGYGTGDELVEGRWRAAYDVPPPSRRATRRQMLEPQQELAGMLAGRTRVLASEDLAMRARLDLDEGRTAQAAFQLEAALVALAAELVVHDAETDDRLSAVAGRRRDVHELAVQAIGGSLDEDDGASLEEALAELERGLRRRRYRIRAD